MWGFELFAKLDDEQICSETLNIQIPAPFSDCIIANGKLTILLTEGIDTNMKSEIPGR